MGQVIGQHWRIFAYCPVEIGIRRIFAHCVIVTIGELLAKQEGFVESCASRWTNCITGALQNGKFDFLFVVLLSRLFAFLKVKC